MTYQIDTTTWRSPNHSPRPQEATTIVVHSCEGKLPHPRETSLPWLCNPASEVSTGYYVCRDTTIYQLVDDALAAWHAGGLQDDGTWTAQPAYSNPHSIGIECEHRAGQDWPAVQKDALAWLLRFLMAAHRIPVLSIDTHGQIAIAGPYKRKTDPTDWPHATFIAWRDALVVPASRAYQVVGLPVYQAQSLAGAVAGTLSSGETVLIDQTYSNGAGHLKSGLGFVDLDGLKAL